MGRALSFLVESFQDHDNPAEFGCCYVNPGIGHYMEHESTTSKRERVLPSHWDEAWVQGGTRRNTAAGLWQRRELCKITEKGPPRVVAECEPDGDERWWWRTGTPAKWPEVFTGVQSWHRINDLQDRFEICGSFASCAVIKG